MKPKQPSVEKIATWLRKISVSNGALYGTIASAVNNPSKIEKVAVYARVSTKDGRQDTENQLIQLRQYCKKQGWKIAATYVDHESGGHSRRPQFQQMFADARARKFDLVLFWSLDRLSREGVSATLQHLERLTAAEVGWRSFTEEYLDSTGLFRDAVIAVLATIAKQERIRRSERASAAIARLRRAGTTDHLGRKRVLTPAKRRDVAEFHAEGLSLREIAKKLKVSPMTVQRTIQRRAD
jgi:DNA invertase Pin-like site-specific DNA recombinase